jgi:hypothetical protein
MSISRNLTKREYDKFLESTSVAEQPGIVVVNPDGTDISASSSAPINDTIYTDGTGTPSKGLLIMGTDGTNPQAISVNSDGELKVNLETADIQIGAVELKNSDTDDRALISDANTARAATDHVLVVQALDAAGAVLSTSALATSAKQPALGTAAMAASTPVTIASDDTLTTAIKTAVETIEDAISGSEMQVDVVGALPAGTNAIGKLAPNSGVDIGDVDVTSVPTCLQGAGNPTVDSYTSASITTAANTANQSLIAAPGANKQIWVMGIQFTMGTGTGTVSFQDEDDTAITGVMPFAANGGMSVTPTGNFAMPLWKVATNKALEVDTVTGEIEGSIQYCVVSV